MRCFSVCAKSGEGNMNGIKILAFTGLAGIAGVSTYLYVQYQKLYNGILDAFKKKPTFVVTNVTLKQVNLDIVFTMINPGTLSAQLTDQQYDIYLNAYKVAQVKGLHGPPIQIHSRSVNAGISKLPINVQFQPDDIIKGGLQNLSFLIDMATWDKAVVTVRGWFKFKAGLLTGQIPLNVSFTLADVVKK